MSSASSSPSDKQIRTDFLVMAEKNVCCDLSRQFTICQQHISESAFPVSSALVSLPGSGAQFLARGVAGNMLGFLAEKFAETFEKIRPAELLNRYQDLGEDEVRGAAIKYHAGRIRSMWPGAARLLCDEMVAEHLHETPVVGVPDSFEQIHLAADIGQRRAAAEAECVLDAIASDRILTLDPAPDSGSDEHTPGRLGNEVYGLISKEFLKVRRRRRQREMTPQTLFEQVALDVAFGAMTLGVNLFRGGEAGTGSRYEFSGTILTGMGLSPPEPLRGNEASYNPATLPSRRLWELWHVIATVGESIEVGALRDHTQALYSERYRELVGKKRVPAPRETQITGALVEVAAAQAEILDGVIRKCMKQDNFLMDENGFKVSRAETPALIVPSTYLH